MSHKIHELLEQNSINVIDASFVSIRTMAIEIESNLVGLTLQEIQNIFEIIFQFFVFWVMDIEDANLLNSLSLDDQNLIIKTFLENYLTEESQEKINISFGLIWNVTKLLIEEILLNHDVLKTHAEMGRI